MGLLDSLTRWTMETVVGLLMSYHRMPFLFFNKALLCSFSLVSLFTQIMKHCFRWFWMKQSIIGHIFVVWFHFFFFPSFSPFDIFLTHFCLYFCWSSKPRWLLIISKTLQINILFDYFTLLLLLPPFKWLIWQSEW